MQAGMHGFEGVTGRYACRGRERRWLDGWDGGGGEGGLLGWGWGWGWGWMEGGRVGRVGV